MQYYPYLNTAHCTFTVVCFDAKTLQYFYLSALDTVVSFFVEQPLLFIHSGYMDSLKPTA